MKDGNGHLMDTPVKFLDDALDAARYAAYHLVTRNKLGAKASVLRVG